VRQRAKLILIAVAAVGLSECAGSPNSPSQRSPTGVAFKVATWNIRSGMGIRGFTTTSWSHETTNCTDQSKPVNAWAVGLLRAQRRPHLFMGDLNTYRVDQWNPSVPCTNPDSGGRMAVINQIEQAGYTDAWKATQRGEGWTGMASRRGCGVPEGNLYKRIDYVYTLGARVLSTTRFGRAAPGTDSPSDHAGLVAEIEIQ
jgi:hypothetical protein